MAKIYTKNTWVDEALAGAEAYEILKAGGGAIGALADLSNVTINLTTGISVAGSAVNAARLNNLENGVDALDTKVAAMEAKNNFSVAAQTPTAATRTYIVGSALTVPASKLKIGTILRWRFNITKTAAGNAASTFDICFGTAGTTADTARLSFTKPGGSAAADEGFVEIEAIVRGPLSGSGIVAGHFRMTHNLASTGHATIPIVDVQVQSSAFDVTVANLIVGVCITSGASDAITIQQVTAEALNL